jgi:hypothetical protein
LPSLGVQSLARTKKTKDHFDEPIDSFPYSQGEIMRIGLIFAVVFAIIIGTILWNRGKPPVP